jgi:deoxycytidylate deaminase
MPISSNVRYKNIKVKVFPLPRGPPERPNHQDNDNDKDHFMAMACLASLRSKDPTRQVMRSYIATV